MIGTLSALFFASTVLAVPVLEQRAVQQLDQAAFEQAQQRDNTATRAFSSTEIKTSDGQCLFSDILSGDFRANLTPIQVAPCDGSANQKWDVITSGKHNNVAGAAVIVNGQTQACINFDPRRAAGNQVNLFSCGGRADGEGGVTDSQLLAFTGGAGPLSLTPKNAVGTCFTVKGKVIDQAKCNPWDASQSFTFGSVAAAPASSSAAAAACTVAASSSSAAAAATKAASTAASATKATSSSASVATTKAAATSSSAAPPVLTAAPPSNTPSANPTTPVAVSRAGGTLQPSAAAESNEFDATATRAFTGVQLKSANGQCLFIDPTAGDFRQNLIPIAAKACDGSANEKFDLITAGKHNNAKGSTLIVSSLMNGCLNFDDRRAAGDRAIMFSCGGRADGEGQTTDSQLFTFTAGQNTIVLAPQNAQGKTCLVASGASLTDVACTGGADQVFSIVQSGAAAPAASSSSSAPAKASSTAAPATTKAAATTSSSSSAASVSITAAPASNIPSANPTTPVPVSRAGGVLQPSAAAESNQFDATATRAFTKVSLKSANGQCLFIDPTAGDFRQNLIPISVKTCDGSPNEKFDFITAGKHNNAKGATLIVSSLMNGCLNFDDRRAAGDRAIMFSCGGRADGDSQTTNSQLFTFTPGQKTIVLAPQNSQGKTCLVASGASLTDASCTGGADQVFSIAE